MARQRKYQTEEEKKAARREYDAKRYQKNKEKVLQRVAEYYKNNREKKLEYQTAYYKENRENILEYHTEYYQTNKEKIAEYQSQWKKNNPEYNAEYRATKIGRANTLLSGYRREDKDKNRGECTISGKWISENIFDGQTCRYCGESDWTKLGVDRKDSSLPHTPDNCVPCCKYCNDKKGTTPYTQYMRMIGKIAKN